MSPKLSREASREADPRLRHGGVAVDDDQAAFNAPWEAQAFAMTLVLYERGLFTWHEWADALALVIAEARERGELDDGSNYYTHWLTALERMVAKKGVLTLSLLERRKHEWIEAARRTPHGRPIEL
ncbi:MAG: nitrile hydratase accessory protein [Betaproteobacteria bacterium]